MKRKLHASEKMHSYPGDLASFVRERWNIPCSVLDRQVMGPAEMEDVDPLPSQDLLRELLSVCYQASLLRDEGRSVKFRLILRDEDRFDPEDGPPTGLHRLIFEEPLPFNERELRRLGPSANFYTSLVGIKINANGRLGIWGIVHSGPRWVQRLYGGGKSFHRLPSSLVIHVTSPGHITVCSGSIVIASLVTGQVICPTVGVFDSEWIREEFASTRTEDIALHEQARGRAKVPWATLDPNFLAIMKKQVFMRVIGRIRNSGHGGTILCIAQERLREFSSENTYVRFKYRFIDEEARKRFRTLLVDISNALAETYAARGYTDRTVGWREYIGAKNQRLARLDEAVFEWAHFVADLAAVDGAVVLSRSFELIGFGGEISGKLDRVETIAKANDLEGKDIELTGTGAVGMRHHSAYRLCNSLHDVIGMVMSQDGAVQIMKRMNGILTVWDQVGMSAMDG